jgi:salicylate hydroxylase
MTDVRSNESKKRRHNTDPRINSSPTKHIDSLDYQHPKPPQTSGCGCTTMNLQKLGLLYLYLSIFCVEGLSTQYNSNDHPASRILQRHLEDSPLTSDQQPQPKSLAAQQACGTVVVGGGIAGLATAIALRTIAGVQNIRIWEQSPQNDFTNIRSGAAAQLGPNGLRALQLLSSERTVQQLRDLGTELEGNAIMMRSKEENTPQVLAIPDTTMQETGYPQVLVRWGLLRSTLADLLPSDMISNNMGGNISGYTCATITKGEEDSSTIVQPIDPSGQVVTDSNTTSSIPLIVGADGAHSTFRALVKKSQQQECGALNHSNGNEILISEKDLRTAKRADMKYRGRVNIKAAVEHTLPAEFHQGHTYAYFAPGGGVACFAGPAGKGFTYWAISIADTVDAITGETKSFLDESNPKVIQERVLEQLNSLQAQELDFMLELIRKTDPSYVLVQPSEEAQGLEDSLHSSDHRLVLVGDAAHAMSPAYGQSANFALEDAATLAVSIRDHDSLDEAIAHYSQSRVQRCFEMQRKSAERSAKSMKGEAVEDVSKWICEWNIK